MKKLFKIINNKTFKITITIFFLLFAYTTICAISYAQNISTNISDSVFRLHVIANSNSDEDQNLKYIVRDDLIEYMNSITKNITSKDEAINLVNQNITRFKEIAKNTISSQGFNYDVNISIGKYDFPTKDYGDISLPSGIYDALKVEIGNATGENWWCVMFPPLCFVDLTTGYVDEDSHNLMKDNLNPEEFSIISEDSDPTIQFKFKLIEFFSDSGLITAKK